MPDSLGYVTYTTTLSPLPFTIITVSKFRAANFIVSLHYSYFNPTPHHAYLNPLPANPACNARISHTTIKVAVTAKPLQHRTDVMSALGVYIMQTIWLTLACQ